MRHLPAGPRAERLRAALRELAALDEVLGALAGRLGLTDLSGAHPRA
jgi:hypothetical protein